MAKVRWSTKCAGGCGRWLPAGSRATFAHRGWWCDYCVHRHSRVLGKK